MTAFAQTVKT